MKILKSTPQKLAYMKRRALTRQPKQKAYNREYYQRRRDMFLDAQLLYAYGLTRAAWDEMFKTQQGRCALCGGTGHTGGRAAKLYVDHDHETGRVRGLICHRCNLGLGALGDNEAGLMRALAYLKGAPCG